MTQVWNGAKIRGANFDGTYMENGKSLEKIREHDAVNWRTTYSIEGQDSDSDSDDEFEIAKGGEQVVSQTRALERQSSTVQSEKDRLKEYVRAATPVRSPLTILFLLAQVRGRSAQLRHLQ